MVWLLHYCCRCCWWWCCFVNPQTGSYISICCLLRLSLSLLPVVAFVAAAVATLPVYKYATVPFNARPRCPNLATNRVNISKIPLRIFHNFLFKFTYVFSSHSTLYKRSFLRKSFIKFEYKFNQELIANRLMELWLSHQIRRGEKH